MGFLKSSGASIPNRQVTRLRELTHADGLLNDIGAGKQRRRDRDAQLLGRLQIQDELILGRRLYRQAGRLLPLKNAIDVGRCSITLV